MSILDVTEDEIFSKLGKGRDPNFKPIEKARPVIYPPKKTFAPAAAPVKVQQVPETIKLVPSPEVEEAIKKLTEELSMMNKNMGGIQAMIKLYIFLFTMAMIIFVAVLGILIKFYVLT